MLNNLRILDFTTLLPGPYASLMLADMGAEVIKIESLHQPDWLRAIPMFDKFNVPPAAHDYINRGKRSLTLDLKQPQAFEVLEKLLKTHDVVIESFRPGAKERLGFSNKKLRAINPKLIICSITGYGQTGPYKDRAGHDNNFVALSGLMSYSGRKNEAPPPLGFQAADIAGGAHLAVMSILAAVIHRMQTGEGQDIDISLADGALALNGLAAASFLVNQNLPAPENHLPNGGCFYGYHKTKDERYLSIAPLEPKFWKAFCEAIERPDLLNQDLSSAPNNQTIKQEIQKIIAKRTLEEWMNIFEKVDACVEPVLNLAEALEHPHYRARESVVKVQSQSQLACPIRFSKSKPSYDLIGAKLGEHNCTILQELGYSPQQIKRLKERKTI